MNTKLRLHQETAEAVRRGHPDKFCDQLADNILDAYLAKDPNARVAVEVMATGGEMLIGGEISSTAKVNIAPILEKTISDIGYTSKDIEPNGELNVHVNINRQSPDIAQAVDKDDDELGAGDQGIVVGYATDETPEYLPLPVVLAHNICHYLDMMYQGLRLEAAGEPIPDAHDVLKDYKGLGADGKAQVTVQYYGDIPVSISTVVVSFQHNENADTDKIEAALRNHLVSVILPQSLLKSNTTILINPSGRFVKGGPAADTGLTGRKLAVDMYGPIAHIGGGALSGKDPTKTDRSGAYAARWVAKCVVASGLARKCEVQIAYAIGKSEPVSVEVNTLGTGILSDEAIANAVNAVFDLRPVAIIKELDLRKPIYSTTAYYGHFGDPARPWENTEKSRELVVAAIK